MKNRYIAISIFLPLFMLYVLCSCSQAESEKPEAKSNSDKPNILVIMGDDIGWFNISAYNDGMMGYKTPNIDRIANEGIRFTDAYGQNSCTAGRAAFITGQSPFRTGLLKVGLPGAKEGIYKEDPTIAEILTTMGYATGQFGKNHLGDLDEHLPTNHGFDEFYGNLYHLNAEEEPENIDYPKDPEFKKKYGPRGVIHSYAGGEITDTGPLTKKSMMRLLIKHLISLIIRQRRKSRFLFGITLHVCISLLTSNPSPRGSQARGYMPTAWLNWTPMSESYSTN